MAIWNFLFQRFIHKRLWSDRDDSMNWKTVDAKPAWISLDHCFVFGILITEPQLACNGGSFDETMEHYWKKIMVIYIWKDSTHCPISLSHQLLTVQYQEYAYGLLFYMYLENRRTFSVLFWLLFIRHFSSCQYYTRVFPLPGSVEVNLYWENFDFTGDFVCVLFTVSNA